MPRAQDKVEAEMRCVRFTQAKVREKIRQLRAAAAADPDHIGPGVLQDLGNEIVEGLKLIFRESFDTGAVPMDWKDANMTAILNPLVPGKFFFEFFAQICRTGLLYDQTNRVKVILH
jgi:hypothetical protein